MVETMNVSNMLDNYSHHHYGGDDDSDDGFQVEKEYGSRLALESPHPGRLKSAQVIAMMTMTRMEMMTVTMTMLMTMMMTMTSREAVSHCTGAETHFLVISRLLSYQRFS